MPISSLALILAAQEDATGFALGDFWSLTQQAGPLRWPIFAVLAFGLIQVFVKLWELVRDRRVSSDLRSADYARMSLDDIRRLVARQPESMLATLESTMLNVFETRPGEGLLHDEITNFVSFQQDQFANFRRRMDFLSDTAGALGLMGTVWGMFTVFFQGTAEQDVILRGMGIALITTLLGLVVSIILNFSATELSSAFSKRLEQVSRKADELRFRLMELAPETRGAAPAPPAPQPAAEPVSAAAPAEAAPARAPVETPAPAQPAQEAWRYVELAHANGIRPAGSEVDDLVLVVKEADGSPAPDVTVLVSVVGGAGSLAGGERRLRARSDAEGRAHVPCALPETVGYFELDVALPESAGPSTRLRLEVGPDTPHRVEQSGNHQAAVAGMRLPVPLGLRVLDRFGNEVPEVPVVFRVRGGDGRLGTFGDRHAVHTDAQGRATVPFVVSSEAGPNHVTATVEGLSEGIDFTAYGTEV